MFFFFFQAEDGIRDIGVTGVQTCALPISPGAVRTSPRRSIMANLPRPAPPSTTPRQLSMALDSARLRGMSAVQRAAAVARLANLLMEAAGLVAGKRDDDRR